MRAKQPSFAFDPEEPLPNEPKKRTPSKSPNFVGATVDMVPQEQTLYSNNY